MNLYPRSAVTVLVAALAVGCGAPPAAPPPRPAPSAPAAAGGHGGAPPPSAAKAPFTLVASGEVLASYPEVLDTAQDDAPDFAHHAGAPTGYDYRPMLKGIKPVIAEADLALCHLGTPLGPLTGPFTSSGAAQAPPQVATALKDAGFDSCATASGHTLDRGDAGVRTTLEALDTVGMRHTGSARDAAEGSRPALLRARGGAEVAHLSYALGDRRAAARGGKPWAVNLVDEQRIVADARAARRAGADLVVVSVEWGTEYGSVPDATQLALARALTAAQTDGRPDLDLLLGTGTRAPQAYERVNGVWVVYGLGDQITGAMKKWQGNWGTVARFRFAPPERPGERWQVTDAEYVPQLITHGRPLRSINLNRTKLWVKERAAIGKTVLSRGAAASGLKAGR
ncbi:CapA family protein [Streptomyces catenulae]|uniref:CapA family protein n=1 Tax=Streptomyces catenulae TaxID=66875 RepID=A0ABV2YT13_9ACTN|nr:CapA family protein [Streptomyces catenulae]